MKHVAILLTPNTSLFELACATEVFALSRPEIPNWYSCRLCTFERDPITSVGGLSMRVQQHPDLSDVNTLIVPSWPIEQRNVKVTMAQQIMDLHERGGQVYSFCSGAFLLAQLGLLKHRQATTHWRYAEQFIARFPDTEYVGDVLYCIHDTIGTSAGSAAALDLSLEIVRRDFGHDVANRVAKRLVLAPHRSGGQDQFVDHSVPAFGHGMADVMDWAIKHLDRPLDVDTLAQQANMSRRSFDRHFRAATGLSPKSWLNQQRILMAKSILEDSDVQIEKLASLVGFDNAITLRSNFNKYVGISPVAYRQQFGHRQAGKAH